MTNAQKVHDLIRQIRGIALNYPDGMAAIADAVDALLPRAPEQPQLTFPHMFAPGRWYLDSNHRDQVKAGTAKGFQGTKDEAIAATENQE